MSVIFQVVFGGREAFRVGCGLRLTVGVIKHLGSSGFRLSLLTCLGTCAKQSWGDQGDACGVGQRVEVGVTHVRGKCCKEKCAQRENMNLRPACPSVWSIRMSSYLVVCGRNNLGNPRIITQQNRGSHPQSPGPELAMASPALSVDAVGEHSGDGVMVRDVSLLSWHWGLASPQSCEIEETGAGRAIHLNPRREVDS